MDLNALRGEIQSGPLAADLAPHVVSGDDAAITAALNAPRYAVLGGVDRAQFAIWCGASGLRAAIEDHASNTASPLRAVALTLLDFLRGGVSPNIDMARAENQAMLAAWVQAGAITPEQKDSLLALAGRLVSRAEQAGLGYVTDLDVRRVLWADDGSKQP